MIRDPLEQLQRQGFCRLGHILFQQCRQDENKLAKLPLLRQLETSLRDELLSRARVIELKPGEFACRQGRADRSLFIVLSGEVAVAKSVKGRRRVVAC